MTVRDTIHIQAPPDVVWAVTVNVERWPEWTPTVTTIRRLGDGPLHLGSEVRIKQPGQPEATWTVTEYEFGRRFAWMTQRPGLRMTGAHELQADGSGTLNTLRLEASGIFARILWPVLRIAVRRALSSENRGLKTRCEANDPPHLSTSD